MCIGRSVGDLTPVGCRTLDAYHKIYHVAAVLVQIDALQDAGMLTTTVAAATDCKVSSPSALMPRQTDGF